MRRFLVVPALLVVVGACSSSARHTTTPLTRPASSMPASSRHAIDSAMRAWSTFPVTDSPRPLVLTSDPVSAPVGGFPSDDTKEAFLTGLFVVPPALPPAPSPIGGLPVISSADALATMRAEGTPAGGAPRPPDPLVITSVTFGSAPFATDRGTVTLPAWSFAFRGVSNPAEVLAVAPAARFAVPPEALQAPVLEAQLSADGRTATITFTGAAAGTGPCTAAYEADTLEAGSAVAVKIREIPHAVTTSGKVFCAAVGYSRTVTVHLRTPLGNRVLVDAATHAPIGVAARSGQK